MLSEHFILKLYSDMILRNEVYIVLKSFLLIFLHRDI